MGRNPRCAERKLSHMAFSVEGPAGQEPALMSAGKKCGRIRPTRTSSAGGHPAYAEKCAAGVRAGAHSMPALTSAGGHPADAEKCGRARGRGCCREVRAGRTARRRRPRSYASFSPDGEALAAAAFFCSCRRVRPSSRRERAMKVSSSRASKVAWGRPSA